MLDDIYMTVYRLWRLDLRAILRAEGGPGDRAAEARNRPPPARSRAEPYYNARNCLARGRRGVLLCGKFGANKFRMLADGRYRPQMP